MEKADVIEKINHTFIENFEIEPEKLTKETKLFEDLELDSLDAVDMIVHMEQNLGIKVDIQKFSTVRTLDDVYLMAYELYSEKNPQ
ncbi:MAG: acyl carrier protein [Bdellovibrionota bacterium]|nr:acyl carrier protein [Bdellovibrionota bacterium]